MKRILLIILLLNITIFQTYSQENNTIIKQFSDDYYYENFNQFGLRALADISLRFLFPIERVENTSFLSFLDIGFGVGFDIIPYIFSPGIYLDLAIGTDWIALFSDDSSDKDDNFGKEEKELTQFAFSFGLRLYNIIKIFDFNIIPFFGCNFMFFFYPLPNIGISLSYKNFAIEYAYYIPTFYEPLVRHHISIKITLNDYWEDFMEFIGN